MTFPPLPPGMPGPFAPPPAQAVQSGPPVDPGNPVLAALDYELSLSIHEPGAPIWEARVSAIPAHIALDNGAPEPRIIWTVRSPAVTFSAFLTQETGRKWVQEIRDFISANMPIIVLPPTLSQAEAPPTKMGLLEVKAFPPVSEGEPADRTHQLGHVAVPMTAEYLTSWADGVERAVYALSGLALPDLN